MNEISGLELRSAPFYLLFPFSAVGFDGSDPTEPSNPAAGNGKRGTLEVEAGAFSKRFRISLLRFYVGWHGQSGSAVWSRFDRVVGITGHIDDTAKANSALTVAPCGHPKTT